MTDFLLNLFVPGHGDGENSQVRSRIGTLSGMVGIFANVLLFLGKILVGMLSGSISIAADALNNLSDASSSVLTLVGFRLASKPADEEHPYGHARLEYLSGLAISVMIMLVGFELCQTSVEKILQPTRVGFSPVVAVVLAASIGVKLWLSAFNQKLGKKIRSTALQATAEDSRNDCIATLAVLAAAVVESAFDLRVDGIIGLAVSVFILRSGWNTAKDTISPLLGERTDPLLRQKIVDYVSTHPKVLGYHDLMVHDYGPGQQFASLHVEMDAKEDPLVCHEIIDDMERECMKSHGIHLVIHYDPVVTDDPELTRLKARVGVLLHTMDPRLNHHDFRMVPGRRHMNLVFDVAIPGDLRGEEERIRREIEDTLNGEGDMIYHVKITFDSADFQ